jgi:BCCT family betaine/carnitine transporter
MIDEPATKIIDENNLIKYMRNFFMWYQLNNLTEGIIMEKRGQINPAVFWPALIVVLGLSVPLAIWPEAGEVAVASCWSFITSKFGWFFLLFGAFCFVVLMWLAFGRYGHVKLGSAEDKPEFSNFSWVAMLFAAGIGIGIMLWSIIEPIYYLNAPPFGVRPHSQMAFEWAHMYGQFHWGFSAWAIYCLPTIPIAYAVYVRKEPSLRISTSCRAILGDLVDGWAGVLIDIIVMFGLVGAVGTSLGLAVPLVSTMFSEMFGIQQSLGLNVFILVLWVLLFGFSLFKGLHKGIKVLSDINIYLAIALIAFVLLAGPTVFILSMWSNSIGLLFNNLLRMSFWLDPITKSGFPQSWTIFYWAWWIAYAPMMGLYVARISRGRTIREVVLAECVWGTLGCWVFFAIFGGFSLYLDWSNIVPVSQILADSGQYAAIVAVLKSIPLSGVVMVVYTILCFVFMATTLASASYSLASISTKELRGDEQPARWNRIFWAVILGVVSMGLLLVGGLKPVQLSSIIAAVPLAPVLIVLTFSGFKMLKEDFGFLSPKKLTIDMPDKVRD